MRETDLYRLADLASELGAEHVASTVGTIAKRVSDGRFYLACVGQFKRGKSTLLNALIGRTILPAGVLPATSVPTIIRFGESAAACIQWPDGRSTGVSIDEIEQYVSERSNPENRKGIATLEIFAPCELLKQGMCLVDTPGLGSIFPGNTKSTQGFIPHMDAVLVVLGADPPISGDELELMETLSGEVPEMLFVLNKADRVSASDLSAATEFARQAIEDRCHRIIPDIFEISALERLEGRGPERDWPKLEQALHLLVQRSRKSLIHDATERATHRASAQLLCVIEEHRNALQRPLEESESRIAGLRQTIDKASEAQRDLDVLFAAEQQRLSCAIAERRKSFLHRVQDSALADLRRQLQVLPGRRKGPAYRRQAMHLVQESARAKLIPWFEDEGRDVEEMFHEAMLRFVKLEGDFLSRMQEMGLPAGVQNLADANSRLALESASTFRFNEIQRIAAPASPLLFVADCARGLFGMRARIERDASEFLTQLLEVNSARVQSDVDERLRESRKKVEAGIRAHLNEIVAIAESALDSARTAQASGASAIQARLARLDNVEIEIRQMLISRPAQRVIS